MEHEGACVPQQLRQEPGCTGRGTEGHGDGDCISSDNEGILRLVARRARMEAACPWLPKYTTFCVRVHPISARNTFVLLSAVRDWTPDRHADLLTTAV